MGNETGRPCTDDNKALRVLLVRDLRAGHPQLKPGLLGRTIPNTSDYYRYVGVHFDIGITEVVSISAVQIVAEQAANELSNKLLAKIPGTAFDWDNAISESIIRKWETTTYSPNLELTNIHRDGTGPHQLYAYTFPCLVQLAKAKRKTRFPVKIGHTATSYELSPSLARIDGQLGESANRFEKAKVLGIWQTWNGRALESRVHAALRAAGHKVPNAIGLEWYDTNVKELQLLIKQSEPVPRTTLPLTGPEVAGFSWPTCYESNKLVVLCTGVNSDGLIYIGSVDFDDLLEEAAPHRANQPPPKAEG